MWCPACRADVAAELSLDSRHFRCTRCSAELGQAVGAFGTAATTPSKPADAERSARDLLARWSAQNVTATSATRLSEEKPAATQEDLIDRKDSAAASGTPEVKPPKKRRLDRQETAAQQSDQSEKPLDRVRSSSWSATIGQVCAYLGIGLITCGTAVVVWGYFGGPPQYAPTGWLVTTIGQMFLFLGVVTLISSGMEQTAAEVASRMDTLGARLVRIESLQHRLAGPHLRRRAKGQKQETRSGQQEAA